MLDWVGRPVPWPPEDDGESILRQDGGEGTHRPTESAN